MDVNSTKSVTQYKCRFCKKCYKRRNYFQNHTLICEEIHKSKYVKECEEEVKQDIPTMQDMYYLLQTFIKKNVELEAKVDELSRYIEKTKKRINIIEWLNENIQLEEDYDEWTKNLSITQKHLQYVFHHGLVQGMNHILMENLPCMNEEKHPIKCFKQKNNTFYYYKDGEWSIMSQRDLDVLITRLDQKLFKQFIIWKNENQHKLDTDDDFYNNVYMVNMHIMLGGNRSGNSTISSEERNEKNKRMIKSNLFHYLEQNIKNIVQYEFTF